MAQPFATADVAVLRERLGTLARGGREWHVAERWEEAASRPRSAENAQSLIERSFGWYWVTGAERGGWIAEEALDQALAAGSRFDCIQALVLLALAAADQYQFADAISTLLEALEFEQRQPVPRVREGVLTTLAQTLGKMSLHDLSCEVAALALQIALEAHNDRNLAGPLNAMGDAYRLHFQHEDMLRFATLALEAAPAGSPLLRGMVLTSHASALYRVGRLEEALASSQQAREWSTEHHDLQNACRAWLLEGTILSARGELSSALDAYHRCIDLSAQTGSRHIEADALGSLAIVYLELGDGENARHCLRQAVRIRKTIGTFAINGMEMVFFPACYALLGKTREAIAGLDLMLRVAIAMNQGGLLARVLIDLGQIHRERGELDHAQHYLQQALRLADGLPAGPARRTVAPIRLQLAALCRDQGDRDGAEHALQALREACPDGIPTPLLPEYYRIRLWLTAGMDPAAARTVLMEGIRELSDLRRHLPQAIPRQLRALASAEGLFETLIELEAAAGDAADLHRLCQQARARRFIDLLSKGSWQAPSQVGAELAAEEQRLLAQLRPRLADVAAPQELYWEAIDQREADRRLQELAALWLRMSESAPAYVQMRQAVVPEFGNLVQVLE